MLLRHYLEQGVSKSALARKLGISRDTIYRWIRSGELERDLDAEPVRYKRRPPAPHKLDPYKPMILARLAAYPKLSAIRLFEEVRAAGYPGGYTRLKDYVREVRPRPLPEPVVRFETPPAQQAQVDFAQVRLPWGVRYGLLVVLGYSRLLWVRFYARQDMRTLFLGLEAAFRFFGGVPREILFDQMRAVVTRDLRLEGGRLVENAEFLRFAAHWGFAPRACRPYRARTKGKVERPIRYLRERFLYGRDFAGDGDLNAQLERWLETVANRRTHGTTGEQPLERFLRDEKDLLLPLAERSYRSLVLLPEKEPQERPLRRTASAMPRIAVERRPLAVYAAVAGGAR
jgi:transposase